MRKGYWLIIWVVVLDLLFVTDAIGFIKLSVPTAFALITATVKIKALLIKILLGLRAYGVRGIIVRGKRSTDSMDFSSGPTIMDKYELLSSWLQIQSALGQPLNFDLNACLHATKPDYASQRFGDYEKLLQEVYSDSREQTNYSLWVSEIIGSLTGRAEACHLFKDELSLAINSVQDEIEEGL